MSRERQVTVRRIWRGQLQEYVLTIPARILRDHGSKAAVMRHYRHRTKYCDACLTYIREDVARDRVQGKPRGGNGFHR